jgi:hemoglobin-like flavoprotein
MLTSHEIQLIKKSWNLFLNIDPSIVGNAFYGKLFFDKPELRRMFPHQMDAQYVKLLQMFSTIVMRLDRPEEITEEIIALAKRHKGYGVKPEHYKSVAEAFVWTLKTGMGREWDQDLEQAWAKCFRVLSNTMIAAVEKTTP